MLAINNGAVQKMIQFAERTHPGRRSGDNEDATGNSASRSWYFVADGMGGQGNGRVASSIVKQSMEDPTAPQEILFAIHHAHQQILAATEREPTLRNMGSTIVALEIKDRMARSAWVGDSRAYLYRDKQFKRITRDHSYVEVLRLIQGLTEEQVRGHPESNVITRGLGMEEAAASMTELPLRTGDHFVLCSDGLTDELTDAEIERVMQESSSVADAADQLINQALAKGGRDNVSVVVVQYNGPSNNSYWFKSMSSTRRLVLAVALMILIAATLLWWRL